MGGRHPFNTWWGKLTRSKILISLLLLSISLDTPWSQVAVFSPPPDINMPPFFFRPEGFQNSHCSVILHRMLHEKRAQKKKNGFWESAGIGTPAVIR